MTKRILAAVLMVCFMAPAVVARAQDASDKDAQEIFNYRLTMDKARAVAKANDALLALLKADPAFAASVKQRSDALDKARRDEGQSDSLSDIVAVVGQEPKLARVIQDAGLTPREYATAELAIVTGTMGVAIKKAGSALPKEFNPAHVAFAEQNAAEVARIMATLDEINNLLDK